LIPVVLHSQQKRIIMKSFSSILTLSLSILPILTTALALPPTNNYEPLGRRQTPWTGTCTVADNQCMVTIPSPYNFTCGLTYVLAGPLTVYAPWKCTVEGHVCFCFVLFLGEGLLLIVWCWIVLHCDADGGWAEDGLQLRSRLGTRK